VEISPQLRAVVESGPLVHLTTVNADGSPQVSVVWAGFDGGDLVTAHLPHNLKVRNLERDPRAVLSFLGPHEPEAFLQPYAVLRTRATVEPSDRAWDVLDALAKVYVSPHTTFPAPRQPGFIVRYAVERISGVGPWVPDAGRDG
jgi:PPOX class probable F420-dependent enzyme